MVTRWLVVLSLIDEIDLVVHRCRHGRYLDKYTEDEKFGRRMNFDISVRLVINSLTVQYFGTIGSAITVVELSDMGPIVMHVLRFVWRWFWPKWASIDVVRSIAVIRTVDKRKESEIRPTNRHKIHFQFDKNLPIWTQTDVVHQCIHVFQTFQASRWMIVCILNDLYRLPSALWWPLNAK